MALELRLTPLTVLLRSVLDQLQEKDPARIFAQPVSLKEVGVLALAFPVLPHVCGDQRDKERALPSACLPGQGTGSCVCALGALAGRVLGRTQASVWCVSLLPLGTV